MTINILFNMSKTISKENDFYNVLAKIVEEKDGFCLQRRWLESTIKWFPDAIKTMLAKQDYIYFRDSLSFTKKQIPKRIKRNPRTGEKVIKEATTQVRVKLPKDFGAEL